MAKTKSVSMLGVGIGVIVVCAAVIAGGVGGTLARSLADNPPPEKPTVQALTSQVETPAQPERGGHRPELYEAGLARAKHLR